ncbi:hypothetical protein NADFUDRAFT_40315 [Nadsonia fulvescens var. elongata DSM 6958]|uniref:Uncharacterized protein n=1 Tax=Nadsonia fulvescens var. elongata DSM 6958 TaxID=857566 RepID=A0A1E3PNX9_9ASCO|nr:hypothetical protein NADFUDRAFT_40315 [Nadsonia fulvescens var. elongata DSM 6958]
MSHKVELDTLDIIILEAYLAGKDRTDRTTVVRTINYAMKEKDPATAVAITNFLASLTYLSLSTHDKNLLRQWCSYHRNNDSQEDYNRRQCHSSKYGYSGIMPLFIKDLEPHMKRHFICYLDTDRFWANLRYVLNLMNGIVDR